MRERLRLWWIAARPRTLTAALAPVAVGTACAHAAGAFRLGPALGALGVALFIQIGTNLANDLFDHEKGADTPGRVGPTRVVQAGLLPPRAVRRAMVLSFGGAAALGLYLATVAGPALIGVGALAIASGVLYTGGPYPLGYHGLGDLFVMIFFGIVAVVGTAYVQAQRLLPLALWTALPVGALATAVLIVNNIRDRQTDAAAGKRTLAVRLGKGGAWIEFCAAMGIAFLVPAGLAWRRSEGLLLLPLLALPSAFKLARDLRRHEGTRLNRTLAGTAQLLLAHSLLLALGIAWPACLTASRP